MIWESQYKLLADVLGEKFMYRKILVLLLIMSLVLALFACGAGKTEQSKAEDGTKSGYAKTDESKADETKKDAEKPKLIGLANLGETIDFAIRVKQGIVKEVEKKGWELLVVDNNLDGATAVKNADLLITKQVDLVLEFNVDSKVAPTIMDKFNAAKIPVVAIDIPHPGAPFFGANNAEAGKIVGRALAKKAKNVWNGQVDLVILVDLPAAGEVVKQRMDNILVGIRESIKVPDDKVIRVDGKNDVLPAKQVVTDTLTAHPDAKHILIGCLNDQNGSGALSAVQTSNREKDCLIASHGCDAPAIINLKGPENCWIGSVAYFPEKYGSYLIPLAEKMLNGEQVPENNHPDHVFIDRSNIDQYYPKQ